MHRLDLLEQAVAAAEQLGYAIRHEWIGGIGGGACEIAGKKWIFVDLALTVSEQLDQVVEALREDQGVYTLRVSPHLSHLLGMRKSA